jgi:hypothetical protein
VTDSPKQRPDEGVPVDEPDKTPPQEAPPHEMTVEADGRDDNEIADERVEVVKRPPEERSS